MKNRTASKMKLPAFPAPDMSNLTKEQLKAEIEKDMLTLPTDV